MLTRQDNELMCRTNAGTAMGNAMDGMIVADRLRSDGFQVAVLDLAPTDDGFGHVVDVTHRQPVAGGRPATAAPPETR